ncbi:cytochrome oxidase Cu insertion factor (SCO1/SenC/PrrC family) [Roseimicrobium gellanilyticum]|uniref:Cytochrome oxidase Cu insertion factor (SCO1/SenC/PrrC family) n=1 Tax=Roseimicrobium gellanilyticum TaxID=748857 RepID=A0A366HR00_9BACT|nr:SCO family protein [Roseimicrobium gellanilyticum]RBP45906.1 cytochrome oxidase Cu insertion factor (SCO1/SenC/PrrC family) [Roseimicrobium gellanilyticum]
MNADSESPKGISTGFNATRFWIVVVTVCLMIVAAATVFYRVLNQRFRSPASLPRFHTVSRDLEAYERTGKQVRMSDLRGKVHTIAYLYTVCPHGCAAVIGEMLKLHRTYGSRSDFHQVSISVLPERDTAEMLAAYAKGIGLDETAPWWFLTGKQSSLWAFMTGGLQLEPAATIPQEEQLNPLDTHMHDLRIVLVDRSGCVRGYYAVFHSQPEIASLMRERLQQDVQKLLDEPAS